MGLLSDPARREKLTKLLQKWRLPLCILSYIGGIVWLLLLASDKFNAKTYISENALLPGMVETRYSEDRSAEQYYNKLADVCNQEIEVQRSWLENELLAAGFEVFEQNFTCRGGKTKGKNIYGILRSARSSGVESLVLNLPMRSSCQSNGGLALLLSVANYFKQLSYWSKDIIFLVTENESCGVTAWLQKYHGEQSEDIASSDLLGHAGKIQAALVVDIPADSFNSIDVQSEGLNGLQPNLDLLNMIFIVSQSQSVPIKLDTQDHFFGFVDKVKDYFQCLKTLIRMMLLQASGYPNGEHGIYLKYRIEAVTMKASKPNNYDRRIHFDEMGRLIEGIFRSFNNLMEHFHQSFFFYLLPASNRYISITLYMPALGGILLSPLLYSISLWMEICAVDAKTTEKSESNKHEGSRKISWGLPLLFLSAQIMGAGLFASMPSLFQNEARISVDGFITKSMAVSSLVLVITLCFLKPIKSSLEWKITKFIVMIYLTAVTIATAMLNFSLGFFLAAGFIPATCLVEVNCNRLRRLVGYIMVVISSPIFFIIFLACLHTVLSQETHMHIGDLLLASIQKVELALKYALTNDHLHVWTLPLFSLVVFPIWIVLAALSAPLKT